MDIDKPLDAIIDAKRAERRSSRGRGGKGSGRGAARGGGAGRGGQQQQVQVVAVQPVNASAGTGPVRNRYSGNIANARNGGGAAAAPAAAGSKQAPIIPLMADGSKIIVSNLPMDVTENQIRDLFTQTVGPVSRIQLSYDKNGKSTGVAHIDLKRAGDAQVAFTQYNARLVDGNRPMKVEIVFDPTRLPPAPLNSRIAPAPRAAQVAVVPVAPAAVAAR